jgi:hypothetical protein
VVALFGPTFAEWGTRRPRSAVDDEHATGPGRSPTPDDGIYFRVHGPRLSAKTIPVARGEKPISAFSRNQKPVEERGREGGVARGLGSSSMEVGRGSGHAQRREGENSTLRLAAPSGEGE